MAGLISQSDLDKFKAVMRDIHDTFETKLIHLYKAKSSMDRFGEDSETNGYNQVPLYVQLNYNYMRTWPITLKTETGDLDRQSVQVLINRDWLEEQGLVDTDKNLKYDPARDYFEIDGLRYIPMGDTPVSQTQAGDVLFSMILKRDDTPTGKNR